MQGVLDALIDASHDAVVVCSADGRVMYWSRGAELAFGCPNSSALGLPFVQRFPPARRSEMLVLLGRSGKGDLIRNAESEVVRGDGLPAPISVTLAPVTDGESEVVGTLALVRDLTEQKLAQASLAEVHRRTDRTEAYLHTGSWLYDVRTGAVQWSPEFHRIHDVDPADFGGTLGSYIGLLHPDDRDGFRSDIERAVASGRVLECSYRITGPPGPVIRVAVRAEPAFSSDGSVVGLHGVGRVE